MRKRPATSTTPVAIYHGDVVDLNRAGRDPQNRLLPDNLAEELRAVIGGPTAVQLGRTRGPEWQAQYLNGQIQNTLASWRERGHVEEWMVQVPDAFHVRPFTHKGLPYSRIFFTLKREVVMVREVFRSTLVPSYARQLLRDGLTLIDLALDSPYDVAPGEKSRCITMPITVLRPDGLLNYRSLS